MGSIAQRGLFHRPEEKMHNQIRSLVLLSSLGLASAASVLIPRVVDVDSCPGYSAKNVKQSSHGFVADLTLAGEACNIYGTDLKDLKLEVTYDSGWFSPVLL